MQGDPRTGIGPSGERFVRQWLKRQGYLVLPISLIENGGAPMLEGWLKKIVASNNLVFRGGRAKWVEVKTKSRITYNRKRGRHEHGIALRLWKAYLDGQGETGIAGALAILQLLPKAHLYLGDLDSISKGAVVSRERGTIKSYGEPMVFFDMNYFDEWYEINGAEQTVLPLPKPTQPHTVRPWEGKAQPDARQIPLDF